MIEPTQDSITEWKQRIEDSAELRFKGIEWQATEELIYLGLTYAEAYRIVSILSRDNIVAGMLRALCKAHNTAFLSSSEEQEGLEDRLDEVINKYAVHRAKQDMSDDIEISCKEHGRE